MSTPQDEDNKPIDQEAYVIFKVKSKDGEDFFFKMKKSSPFQKLMNYYCYRQGLELHAFCFIFDGRRISREQTPYELDMKDGDVIHECRAMMYVGGLRANQRQWSYMVFDHNRL